jgi:hypothetical protein
VTAVPAASRAAARRVIIPMNSLRWLVQTAVSGLH